MSSKLSVVRHPGPEDDWDQFRPAHDLQVLPGKRSPKVPLLLVLATVLFGAVVVSFHFQPKVKGAVAHIAKAVLDLGRPARVIAPTKSVAMRSVPPRRKLRHLRPEMRARGVSALGPFEAYVLDGDRYIRVEGISQYALLDTRTGKIIWIRTPQ